MTTTVTLDISTTLTTQLEITQTAIVQGILDLTITQTVSTSNNTSIMSESETFQGITLANKAATTATTASGGSSSVTEVPATTISTILSSSTSTSTSTSTQSSASSSATSIVGSFSTESMVGTVSSKQTSLAIGIPVAIVGTALIVLFLWYYIHNRRRKSKAMDNNFLKHYDEKFNYRKSPSHLDYDMGAVYQVRGKPEAMKRYINRDVESQQQNQSEISLNDPHGSSRINSKWNMNTPLSKWFAKHAQVSAGGNESRASLSTGPFSPIVALKEFKLMKSKRNQVVEEEINEKSPIFPRFPEASYQPYNYHSTNYSVSSYGSDISEQQLPADFTKNIVVPKLQPVSQIKKQKQKEKKQRQLQNEFIKSEGKPLPEKPLTINSASALEGLEQRVYERMIPTTPVVDLKVKDDHIYECMRDYQKNMADELTLTTGEFVKVLARHTDGWCLVEKVDGQSGKSLGSTSGSYLNDSRGVVPGMCLIQRK